MEKLKQIIKLLRDNTKNAENDYELGVLETTALLDNILETEPHVLYQINENEILEVLKSLGLIDKLSEEQIKETINRVSRELELREEEMIANIIKENIPNL